MSIEGNISKKYGPEGDIENADLDYIAGKLADMAFQTKLIDALNTKTIYEGREFWNAIIAKLEDKVAKVDGKGLSTNDYTTEDKQKLLGLAKRILDIDKALLTKVSEDSLNANLGFKVDKLQYNADIIALKNSIKHSVDNEPIPGSDKPISSDYVYGLKQTYDMQFATFFNDMNEVEAIAKGRATGYVFDTVDDLDVWLSDSANKDKLVLGDNFYIKALDVPDYWWDGQQKQQLETQKVNLPEITEALNQKQDKPKIVETFDGNVTVSLESNQIYYANTISTLTLNAPEVYDDGLYTSYLSFNSGATPTTFKNNTPFKLVGDDVSEIGEFTPQPNTIYELMAMDVGSSSGVVIRVGASR